MNQLGDVSRPEGKMGNVLMANVVVCCIVIVNG